jgi:tyrosine-protein kinase Etk/Wzc
LKSVMAIDTDIPLERHGILPAASPIPAVNHEDEISLLDLLIVLANRKGLIVTITLAFGGLGLLLALILPKRYTAEATVLPPQQNSSMTSALASQLGSIGAMASLAGRDIGLKNPNDMYVAMFNSQTVEDAMVRRFELMQEYREKYLSTTRKSFEHYFTVNGSGKDGLIRVSVEDKDPKRAAEMANAWIEEFRRQSQTLAIGEASQRRLFFELQMQQAKDNLANAEEALKKTQQTTGVIQMDSQARALIESAVTLRAQIAAKEVQLQGMRTYATSENSGVVEVQQELDGLRAQLAKLGGSEDGGATGLIVPKGKVPEAGLQYIRKLRDVKYYETIFEIIARQFEMAKLDEAKEGAVVQVVDPALVPDRKSSPKRALIVLAALAIGFFLGVLIVLARAGVDRMRQDPETSEKLSFLRRALRVRP